MGVYARKRETGQTLIVAILVLGILLILGIAFAQIISRSIREAGQQNSRMVASDLAKAGVNWLHYQLSNSELGADYRPAATPPAFGPGGLSRDPDALYLRPGTGMMVDLGTGELVEDRGGPDFKGAYSRELTEKGRRLVRVTYRPADFDAFASNAPGTVREKGRLKNYLVIDSVGRYGSLTVNGRLDASKQLPESIQVDPVSFGSPAAVVTAVSRGRTVDTNYNGTTERKMVAYASIGIIEHGHFITDKHMQNKLADIGFPFGSNNTADPYGATDLAVMFNDNGAPLPIQLAWPLGNAPAAGGVGRPNWNNVPGGGDLYSNTGVRIFGHGDVALNTWLGEAWKVHGPIKPADMQEGGPGTTTSQLTLYEYDFNRGTNQWTGGVPVVVAGTLLDSDNPTYSTQRGLLRDGGTDVDVAGEPRGVGVKVAPSIQALDPQTNTNRMAQSARSSGIVVNGRNIGRWGLGGTIYVDAMEKGNLDSEDERRQLNAARSLPNDWLNPNNQNSIGWQGPYYIPVASYLHLLPDGFEIFRDSRSRNRYWRNPNGSSTNNAICRYRVRVVEYPIGSGNMQPFIINSIQNPALATAALGTVTDDDFRNNGVPFSGVLFFEGDVRTRGVIATDMQLSVVSMGTIYIEGSILKGNINTCNPSFRIGTPIGADITGPSASMLMLMARDYICLNTTQFFGPQPGQSPAVKTNDVVADTPSPIELDIADSAELTLMTQFPRDPATGLPWAMEYSNAGGPVVPQMFITSAADDNGPGFIQADIRPVSFGNALPDYRSYPFPTDYLLGATTVQFNAAAPYYPVSPTIPMYGVGDPSINAYPRFETIAFDLTIPGTSNVASHQIQSNPPNGYHMAYDDPTLFRLRLSSAGSNPAKNWLIGRTAIAPNDVRIEAAMFAEEGSFFVIPGHWFNTNSDDNRPDYLAGAGSYSGIALADRPLHRYRTFGNTPSVPFYAEPLDVRITMFGAISENMPAPMSQQVEWLKKWGWIPRELGESTVNIPDQHVPAGYNIAAAGTTAVPNLILTYDPNLATATMDGLTPIRRDKYGWVLPPMPRLPVSPTLAYIGDVQP
jgi:hypothetical protein